MAEKREWVVPVFLTVEAESAAEARSTVVDGLSDDSFDWPFPVSASCVGNEDEVAPDPLEKAEEG